MFNRGNFIILKCSKTSGKLKPTQEFVLPPFYCTYFDPDGEKQLCQNDYGEMDFESYFNEALIHVILVIARTKRIEILAVIFLKTGHVVTKLSRVVPKFSQIFSKLSYIV